MHIEDLRDHCMAKAAVTEEFPFDEDTLVFKVAGKMFALTSLSQADRVNLKCRPELAVELREQYSAVLPGWHMNKTHWNTVIFDGSISDDQIREWIDLSYEIIVESLSKKIRKDYNL